MVTMIEYAMTLTQAVVLLKIDDVLGNHDRILNVGLDPLEALDTLVTSVPGVKSISQTFYGIELQREIIEFEI